MNHISMAVLQTLKAVWNAASTTDSSAGSMAVLSGS